MGRQKRRGGDGRQEGEGPQVSGLRLGAQAVPETLKANPAMVVRRDGFGGSRPMP